MEAESICYMLLKEEMKAQQSGISSPWGGLGWYRKECDEMYKKRDEIKMGSEKIQTIVDPTISTKSTTDNMNYRLYWIGLEI